MEMEQAAEIVKIIVIIILAIVVYRTARDRDGRAGRMYIENWSTNENRQGEGKGNG